MKEKIRNVLELHKIPYTEGEGFFAIAPGIDLGNSLVDCLGVTGMEKICAKITISGHPYIAIYYSIK